MSEGVNQNRPGERMYEVIRASGLTPMERLTVAALAYFDGKGQAWPSLQTLADHLGITRYAAHNHLKGAKTKRFITWQHGQATNIYTIFYDKFTVRKSPTVKSEVDCKEIGPADCKEIDPLTVRNFLTRTGEPDINRSPPLPPRERGGRVRRRKQTTLDVTAEAVMSLLNDNENER